VSIGEEDDAGDVAKRIQTSEGLHSGSDRVAAVVGLRKIRGMHLYVDTGRTHRDCGLLEAAMVDVDDADIGAGAR
jgi:hypothetical protein